MARHAGLDVWRVAAAHCDRDWKPAVAARVEHRLVALAKARDGEPQPAEPIALVWIGAGKVEHDVRTVTVENAGKVGRQRRQIFVVSGAVVEREVQIAGLLAKWKVVRAVQRTREHGAI